MNIRVLAVTMTETVERFRQKAKTFFYQVMLLGYRCPACNARLQMSREGLCRCATCGRQLDPTIAFQRCSACGGMPERRLCRYYCHDCGAEILSRFLFDGLVFDVRYFREKMAESRQRSQDRRQRVRQMLAESRSGDLPLPAADLDGLPDLIQALDALTAGTEETADLIPAARFDLRRYERHIQAHLQEDPIGLDEIPPLDEDGRKDRIWRFVAVIFLAHYGVLDVWQEKDHLLVRPHETNREGQGVPDEFEEADQCCPANECRSCDNINHNKGLR